MRPSSYAARRLENSRRLLPAAMARWARVSIPPTTDATMRASASLRRSWWPARAESWKTGCPRASPSRHQCSTVVPGHRLPPPFSRPWAYPGRSSGLPGGSASTVGRNTGYRPACAMPRLPGSPGGTSIGRGPGGENRLHATTKFTEESSREGGPSDAHESPIICPRRMGLPSTKLILSYPEPHGHR